MSCLTKNSCADSTARTGGITKPTKAVCSSIQGLLNSSAIFTTSASLWPWPQPKAAGGLTTHSPQPGLHNLSHGRARQRSAGRNLIRRWSTSWCLRRGLKNPAHCWWGDTTHDLAMGQNAGVSVVALAHGAHTGEELAALRPMAVCANIAELRHFLLPA